MPPTETALDLAHRAMMAAPEDERARLRYFHRLADSELLLLLENEPADEVLTPSVWTLVEGRFALAFDSEERLAAFSDVPVPYAALPGRVLAAALSGQEVGLGINLSDPERAFLMPAGAVGWLAGVLAEPPARTDAAGITFTGSGNASLAPPLSEKLAGLGHLMAGAWLVALRHGDGREAEAIVFEDAPAGAEDALAKAAAEAIQFAAFDPAGIDILFLDGGRALESGLRRVGLRVAVSAPVPAREPAPRPAPGSDPDRPPKLR